MKNNYDNEKIDSMLSEYYRDEQVPERVMRAISEGMDRIDAAHKSSAVGNCVSDYSDCKEGTSNTGDAERVSAGSKTGRLPARAAIALAAAVLLIFTVLQVDPVRAAVEKLFAFIPGVGMVEEEKNSVMLYLDGRDLTKENGYISLCLDNAYVTRDGIQINYKLSLLKVSMDEADSLFAEKKDEAAYNDFLNKYDLRDYISVNENDGFISIKPDIKLYANGTAAEETFGAVAGGSTDISGFYFYKLDTAGIDQSTELAIQCGDIKIDFHVREYETYSSADEIGATQCHNNVVITAVPRWGDKKLKVDIYANNGSIFDGVTDYGYYLYDKETESYDKTKLPYVTIDDMFLPLAPMSGYNGSTLEFDLSGIEVTEEMKKKAVLHIPSVSLYNNEERSVGVTIDKDKVVNEINKELQFEGGTLTVVSAEHVADFYADGKDRGLDESNVLKLTLKFEPNESGASLDSFRTIYYNSDNGFSWETDRDKNEMYVYIDYEKPYYKIKKLKFANPVYIYYDEYELKLG